jgi:AcrR family transcriptional regulator
MSSSSSANPPRRTQADRRAATREALLESAARGLSRHGYGNLVLEQVAAEAGYTRGALYHLFEGKEDLALAVVDWVAQTWEHDVGDRADRATEPVAALIALARGHVIYCRRDVARVLMTLRLEFGSREHPVGRAVQELMDELVRRCTHLVAAGRRAGKIAPGPPAKTIALAFVGAIEGMAIQLAGVTIHDEQLAERIVLGLLGMAHAPDGHAASA